MAESQKEASSTILKQKNSLLDMDFGNDFITSWKSMSMAEDDAIDFGFAPVSKDKKKSFNFDKADMDFNLDADFGNLSSFKMDVPDIDISSPFKKNGKSRENSEDKSANGNKKAKADHFAFALDFDELGSFSFESSLGKEGIKAKKKKDGENISKLNEDEDEKSPPLTNITENTSASEIEASEKPLLPGTTTASVMDTHVDRCADVNTQSAKSPSKLVMDDIGTSAFSNLIDQVASPETIISPDKTFSSSRQQCAYQCEETIFPEPVRQEACITNGASQDLTAHSVSSNQASPITGSKLQDVGMMDKNLISSTGAEITGSQLQEVGVKDINLTSSIEQQNVTEKPIGGCGSGRENANIENSHSQGVAISRKNDGEEGQVVTENHSFLRNKEKIEHDKGDSLVHNSTITSIVMGSKKASAENLEPASKILKTPPISKPVDKFMSENERGPLVTRSSFFMGSDKEEPRMQKAQSTQMAASLLSRKEMGYSQQSLLDEKRARGSEDVSGNGKKTSVLLQQSRATSLLDEKKQDTEDVMGPGEPASSPQHSRAVMTEPHRPGILESCKGIIIERRGTGADGMQDGTKLNDYSSTRDKDVLEENYAQKESQNTKSAEPFSSNMQMSESTPWNHPNLRMSLFTMKNTLVEEEKSASVDSRRNSDLCGLKLSRTSGSDLDSSKSASHKDLKSLVNSTQNRTLSGNKPSKIDRLAVDTASYLNIKNSAEAKKLTQVNSDGRNFDLFKNLSRNHEANHDSMMTMGYKDVNSMGKVTHNNLLSRNELSNILGTLKKMPSPSSLKRKTLEESDGNMMLLSPSKRLSQSPRENRSFSSFSERVVDEKVSNHDYQEDGTKSTFAISQDSSVVLHETKRTELEAPFSVDNNGYIKQAEALTKELENICNMLSKKHEEAKDILVRSIVNNNKLLMLDHPLYEEKIQMVQKFAARLTLNETHA